jgi:thermosome
MMSDQPVVVLEEGTSREQGRDARSRNILAAKAVSEAVRSTLGPKGMDKMLASSSGDIVITNDGATILDEIDVEHPAANMVIEVASTQDDEVGDGTTTAVVLAGELLKKAEDLVEDVHATRVTRGYSLAAERANEILEDIAEDIDRDDREILNEIATTALASKGTSGADDVLSEVVVDAVRHVAQETDDGFVVDPDDIKVESRRGGSVTDTELVRGVLLDDDPVSESGPQRVADANVALFDAAFEVKETEVDANVEITDPSKVQAFLDEEERILEELVGAVEEAGADVVVTSEDIDDMAAHLLAKRGVFAVDGAGSDDLRRLSEATGGNVVTAIREVTAADLGAAGTVETRRVGGDDAVLVQDCPEARAVTILVRGGTEHVLEEAERTLEDARGVVATALEGGRIVPGAAASEVEVAQGLREYAQSVGGREQLAIDAFAEAVETVPRALAENAGLDPIDTLVDLRKAHQTSDQGSASYGRLQGDSNAGIDLDTGEVVDVRERNVIEPLEVKTQAIDSASEVASLILRIDDVIASKGIGE